MRKLYGCGQIVQINRGVPSQFSNEPDLQDTSLLQLLLEKYACRFHNVSITSVVGQKTNIGLNSSLGFLWR